MTELRSKTAIIAGASRGIGEATARHLASLGANVVLAARGAAHITRIAAEIARHPAAHPEILATSARTGTGIAELRAALAGFAGP